MRRTRGLWVYEPADSRRLISRAATLPLFLISAWYSGESISAE